MKPSLSRDVFVFVSWRCQGVVSTKWRVALVPRSTENISAKWSARRCWTSSQISLTWIAFLLQIIFCVFKKDIDSPVCPGESGCSRCPARRFLCWQRGDWFWRREKSMPDRSSEKVGRYVWNEIARSGGSKWEDLLRRVGLGNENDLCEIDLKKPKGRMAFESVSRRNSSLNLEVCKV